MTRARRALAMTACTLLLAGMAAACGDDDEGDEATATTAAEGGTTETSAEEGAEEGGDEGAEEGGGASDAAEAAQERVDPLLEEATSIGIEEPLTGPVEEGKSVYWLEGNIQSILPITQGFEEATEAIGWDLTTVTYDPADPQGPSAAMRQAVDGGADYIAVSGQTIDILGEALEAAKSAGIPVIEMFSTDEVGGEENGIHANISSAEHNAIAYPAMGDLVIADSGGEAHMLLVHLPDFAILQAGADPLLEQMETECPDCEVTELNLSIQDLVSGNVSSQVISSLQSNPDINYVYVMIGDLASGLPEALAGAGLAEQVKIVGLVPNPEQLQSVADGTSFAYMPLPRPMAAWSAVDAMARIDVGMDVDQDAHATLPMQIWTTETVPTPVEEFEGPEDYQGQFLELWGIGS